MLTHGLRIELCGRDDIEVVGNVERLDHFTPDIEKHIVALRALAEEFAPIKSPVVAATAILRAARQQQRGLKLRQKRSANA